MRVTPKRLLLCVGPALITAALSVGRPTALTGLDHAVYDIMVRAIPVRPPSGRVVIVDVDERSLEAVGQWPWPRNTMAELIDRLQALGAAVVASDVIFAEPERTAGGGDPDAALAHAVASPRVVLGYALRFDQASGAVACGHRTINVAFAHKGDDDASEPLFRATGAVCNLPVLNEAATASGFLNAAPDSDGILRRVPLLIDVQGRASPSLALAAVSRLLNSDTAVLQTNNAHASRLRLSRGGAATGGGPVREVALDGRANLLLRYRGVKGRLRHVSAVDVLGGAARSTDFEGQVVFIGTTALGTREVVATPLDTLFNGVEVQGTVADNLLQEDALYRPEHGRTAETTLLMLLSLASALAIGRCGVMGGTAVTACVVAVVWTGAIALLSSAGMLVSPLYATIATAGTVAAMTAARLTDERRRADQAGHDQATSQSLMVETLLALTEMRDAATGQHSRRIQLYTRLLADQLRQHPDFREYLTADRIALLCTLATLHDIGKVGVPDGVLQKPGPLTAEEFAEMQRHPTYGRDVIANAERVVGVRDDAVLNLAKDIVYTHHEKWDGTGYPEGISGTSIPIPGRLVAVVDVYDALVAHRPYRKAMTHDQAEALIVKGSGTHFDPRVVEAFLVVSPAFRALSELALAQAVESQPARRGVAETTSA